MELVVRAVLSGRDKVTIADVLMPRPCQGGMAQSTKISLFRQTLCDLEHMCVDVLDDEVELIGNLLGDVFRPRPVVE